MDTNALLSHYFAKRIVDSNEYRDVLQIGDYNDIQFTDKDMLMVIDMQNDFVDRNVEGITGPEVPGVGKIGAFAVTNGKEIISPIVDLYKKALNKKARVVFTRDVHPCDHCSFFKSECDTEKPPAGPFPPHCVSQTVGSGLVQEIRDELITRSAQLANAMELDTDDNKKFSVVFKGCNANVDSFGAFKYDDKDKYLSKRQFGNCDKDKPDLTGSFYAEPSDYKSGLVLKDDFDIRKLNKNDVAFANGIPFEVPASTSRIFVVGLAGDYCVRDTALNLRKAYPEKEVIVIYELTRNAFIQFLPVYKPPTEDELKQMTKEDREKQESLKRTLQTTVDAVKAIITDKPLENYVFKFDNGFKSLSQAELVALTVETLFDGSHYHFLTDIKEIFDGYKENGVKVMVNQSTIDSAKRLIESTKTPDAVEPEP